MRVCLLGVPFERPSATSLALTQTHAYPLCILGTARVEKERQRKKEREQQQQQQRERSQEELKALYEEQQRQQEQEQRGQAKDDKSKRYASGNVKLLARCIPILRACLPELTSARTRAYECLRANVQTRSLASAGGSVDSRRTRNGR
jgi:hypothetical protein